MNNTSHKLLTILNSTFIHEVQIAQTKLQSEGITSFIIDENINSTIGTSFIEGYKLQVNQDDVIPAKKIIDSITE